MCIVLTSLKTRKFSQELFTGDDRLNEFKKKNKKQATAAKLSLGPNFFWKCFVGRQLNGLLYDLCCWHLLFPFFCSLVAYDSFACTRNISSVKGHLY